MGDYTTNETKSISLLLVITYIFVGKGCILASHALSHKPLVCCLLIVHVGNDSYFEWSGSESWVGTVKAKWVQTWHKGESQSCWGVGWGGNQAYKSEAWRFEVLSRGGNGCPKKWWPHNHHRMSMVFREKLTLQGCSHFGGTGRERNGSQRERKHPVQRPRDRG